MLPTTFYKNLWIKSVDLYYPWPMANYKTKPSPSNLLKQFLHSSSNNQLVQRKSSNHSDHFLYITSKKDIHPSLSNKEGDFFRVLLNHVLRLPKNTPHHPTLRIHNPAAGRGGVVAAEFDAGLHGRLLERQGADHQTRGAGTDKNKGGSKMIYMRRLFKGIFTKKRLKI